MKNENNMHEVFTLQDVNNPNWALVPDADSRKHTDTIQGGQSRWTL